MNNVVFIADRRRDSRVSAHSIAAPWIALGASAFALSCVMTHVYAEVIASALNAGRRQ